jgi:hypothetical protein
MQSSVQIQKSSIGRIFPRAPFIYIMRLYPFVLPLLLEQGYLLTHAPMTINHYAIATVVTFSFPHGPKLENA